MIRRRSRLCSALCLVSSLALTVGCQSGAAIGTGCERSSDCSSPLVCRLARCRDECRLNRDCPVGTRCLLDSTGLGACSLSSDVCAAGTCSAGLICVEGACVSGCDPRAPACPADARCVAIAGTSSGVCDDTRNVVDAGVADAEIDAGACTGSNCAGATAIAIAGMGDGFQTLACVVRHGGEVWCWGADPLGDGVVHAECLGRAPCSPVPARVVAEDRSPGKHVALANAMTLAGGEEAMCALLVGGGLRCWGETGNGELPISSASDHTIASMGIDAVGLDLAGVELVSLGQYVGYVRMGTAWLGWGAGRYGSLTQTVDMVQSAARLPALDGAIQIASGQSFGCGLWPLGEVRCWGQNDHGQIGHGPIVNNPDGSLASDPVPQRVMMLGVATSVSAAANNACALVGDGVWCWGFDENGSLGTVATSTAPCSCEIVPVQANVPTDVHFVSLTGSPLGARFCGIADDHRVFCWGESSAGGAGALSDVVAPQSPILVAAGVPLHATQVALGPGGGCAIDLDGEVWCWGDNRNGGLGSGTDADPHAVAVHVVFP